MLEPLWSIALGHAVRALHFAREAELLLVRGEDDSLTLIHSRGELQSSARLTSLVSACISDDGTAFVAVGSAGQVWWLAPDLSSRFARSTGAAAVAVASDPFGQYVAVSDRNGGIHLFDRTGRVLGVFTTPRAAHHLAFVPMQAHLAAAADFGWAGYLDLSNGQWLWTDRPVSNIGALAVAGSGDPLLLACFSIGVRRYDPGGYRGATTLPKPCSQIALTFAGEQGIAGGSGREVYGFNNRGDLTQTHELPHTPTAMALAAFGERIFAGFADGAVAAYQVK